MSDYQLGDRVTMTGTVKKVHTELPEYGSGFTTTYADDVLPRNYDVDGGVDVRSGVVVGRRFLQEGVTKRLDDYGTHAFKQSGTTHRVWIISYDLRRKPVMCFGHQISKETEK